MPTKTISIDLEAYDRLRRARRSPDESFSRVIKRATWEPTPCTAGQLLAALRELRPTDEDVIARLDEAQATDIPPEDPWRDS
ncbi:MAG: hypothetical protein FIA95_01995 [Gemmatimonadetes bacterium]|nr:hypothetical protein [Gemmatimonadota bacterium]